MRKEIVVTRAPTHPKWATEIWKSSRVFCRIKVSCESLRGQQPHFSVTVDGRDFGGCCHDLVLHLHPELKPVVDLHLSTDEGVPMHAIANAVHWTSGVLTDLPGFPYRPNSAEHDRGEQTPEFCTRVLGEHLRMDPKLVLDIIKKDTQDVVALYHRRLVPAQDVERVVKAIMTKIVDTQRGRWKQEAELAKKVIADIREEP
jgi:hypothetical protein